MGDVPRARLRRHLPAWEPARSPPGSPRLRARLGTAAAGYGAVPDASVEFGLRAILDGLEDQLTQS